jgi:glycosyltransferase involved in cell wall biosynthesis
MSLQTSNILYISYDGMTDPLGQSQVLPYIIGLSKSGFNFTLISCEKKDRYQKNRKIIEKICSDNNIDWQPISFSTKPPILAKYYDIYRIEKKAFALHSDKNFALVHCRSYISAAIGLKMKRKLGVKFLFDMRGFWVDERVDGGLWNLKNPIYSLAYKLYKKKEEAYLNSADEIISLTKAGKAEMHSWSGFDNKCAIDVIPCSADFEHFQIASDSKNLARQELGIDKSYLVMSYLGSLGTWYLLPEMVQFFLKTKEKFPKVKFLFITPDAPEQIYASSDKVGISRKDLIIISSTREKVPFYMAASDLSIFFIKQSFSKISSSPTKLGEILALGIPVICNTKIGDVEEIIEFVGAGVCLKDFSSQEFNRAIDDIPELLTISKDTIRKKAFEYYDLDQAVGKYLKVYKRILALN